MGAFHRVVAFVDWNSQIHAFGIKSVDFVELARLVMAQVCRRIATSLAAEAPEDRFLVDLRLYHGWHKGFEPTDNRKAVAQVIAETDFSAASQKPNVVFSGIVEYGNKLLVASVNRLHERLSIHLPNTLKYDSIGAEWVEKMVDTAMATDIVCQAYQDPDTWIVVIGEDDDLVPPVFSAEVVLGRQGSRVLLVRKRSAGPFLNLSNILCGAK